MLGDGYTDEPIADNMDVQLILGEQHLEKGDGKQSLALFDRVLQARTQVYFENFLGKRGIACDPEGGAEKLW